MRLPHLGSSKLVTRWIILVLALSIACALSGWRLGDYLALDSRAVVRGQVWRLATWPLVYGSPWGILVSCAVIYKFGGELAVRWGDRRLGRFVAQIVIGAGVVTCLAALLVGAHAYRLGGWAATDVLIIAWARQFPTAVLTMYGFFPLSGKALVQLTVAANVLAALFVGPIAVAPELCASIAAAAYPVAWLRR